MRQRIISDLYQNRDIHALIMKMDPPALREDLRQEVFLVICELSDEKLYSLHDQGLLKFFAVRTILNLIQSTTSPFYTKYRKNVSRPIVYDSQKHATECYIKQSEDLERRQKKEDEEVADASDIAATIETMHEAKQILLGLYIDCGNNAAEVARRTGIPPRSVRKMLSNLKEEIIKKHG